MSSKVELLKRWSRYRIHRPESGGSTKGTRTLQSEGKIGRRASVDCRFQCVCGGCREVRPQRSAKGRSCAGTGRWSVRQEMKETVSARHAKPEVHPRSMAEEVESGRNRMVQEICRASGDGTPHCVRWAAATGD
jgi:hypothetical protein